MKIVPLHASSPSMIRSQLSVGGMNCGSCARHVETTLRAVGDVTARVDLAGGTAVVDHAATIGLHELVAAIEDAGYTVDGRGRAVAG